MNETIEMMSLPANFRPYPCGENNLDGSVEVDLGKYKVNGIVKQYHMRIDVKSIKNVVAASLNWNGESRQFYQCINVFKVANLKKD